MTKLTDEKIRPESDSVERAIAEVGDSWSFLILRDTFFGVRRFDALLNSIKVSPNILSDRLKKLVRYGILKKQAYQERPMRFEYRLTQKGRDLYPAIVLLMKWGDAWAGVTDGDGGASSEEAPLILIHTACGQPSNPKLICDQCDQPILVREMDWSTKD
ncbi:winged helix-turn-helix transcriptional regulator [Parasphingorhabdus sp.]|uniref:winged helix-turn-helix transcriptional regulator n=1 Tax=Parasphingorhabdus sp. TaxID=2709688 RepID=UPI003BB12DD4